MANKISTQAKEELVQVLKVQYRKSLKTEKSQILNQFIAVSGYHRKHAIRILNTIAPETLSHFANFFEENSMRKNIRGHLKYEASEKLTLRKVEIATA